MKELDKDSNIFGNTSFADMSKHIYSSTKKRSVIVNMLVDKLSDLIKTSSDATFVVPLLKDMLESDIKNQELQIKLTNIIQRLIADTNKKEKFGKDTNDFLSESDIKLLEEIDLDADTFTKHLDKVTSENTPEKIKKDLDELDSDG